jgi:hypothetical protein
MKKLLLLLVTLGLAVTTASYAQNTYPWPASGNVGIGTTSPGEKLDINGNIMFHDQTFYLSGDRYKYLSVTNQTGDFITLAANPYSQGMQFGFSTPGSPGIFNPKVTLLPSGNVGIGATNPLFKLSTASGDTIATSVLRLSANYVTNGPYYGIEIYGFDNGITGDDLRVRGRTDGFGVFSDLLTIKNSGNVGIGTVAPEQKLHVVGGRFQVNTAAAWDNFQIYTDGTHSYIEANGDEDGLWIRSNVGQKVIIPTANVGIGTTNPTEKLSVNGKIRAKEVIVDTGWSDYVFADDYKLQSLASVEAHIKTNKHLPGVPSAQEVAEKGVSVGDMQALLLAKIEELTLHQIAQEKNQIAQEKAIGSLQNKVQSLETENAQLKAQTK